ncbi:ABC transporter substrate-binding protein [Paenibacillus agaridevorans]|uniref:ABC transporter substrate-binding protein n=1 Tax=Paenibacillus agaridevorans TaxID=171404 RepID=A0A2R5EYE9_9BACL|nr:extracellular solute-binding protein [Paenibacillus agaridevorans]GBG08401.1 ABC transporter substrate-binding protein [Paenibacillus agaridevorans]
MVNKKKVYKVTSIIIGMAMLAAGCVSAPETEEPSTPEKNQAPAAASYPLQAGSTITSWQPLNNNLSSVNIQNMAETSFGITLEKQTGIKVSYTHPSTGQITEKFNLMVASSELTDVVEYTWTAYPGGPEKAINDNVILPLNDIIDQYAPNLKKTIEADPELARQLKTDSGQYYVFPMLRESPSQLVYMGPVIRKDWLDELGLPVPATIDEWYTTLKAFKEKKNAASPFTARYAGGRWDLEDAFIGAFQTSNGFHLDDQGKVHYGPYDPQFKEVLTLLRKWYQEGLIDKDFAIPDADGKILDNKITSGISGATVGALGGGIGRWLDTMKTKDPKYNLVGAPYPVLNKGEKAFIGQRDFKYYPGGSAAISASSKNVETAARWLDYAYSEEGRMLFNYGIEGESYKLENGVPKFTDLIVNNEKFNLQQMLSQYSKQNGPYPIDKNRNTNTYKQQNDAAQIWSDTEAEKHMLPKFITPTPEESDQVAKIVTDLNSYKEEMFVKFIMGKESLDDFEKYQKQLNAIGVEKVIAIYQSAYDRYLKR